MDALVIIDVQMGMFSDPAFVPHEGTAVIGRIRQLLDRARGDGIQIFFVQHDGGPGDPLTADGPGFPVHPDLAPNDGERVIVKRQCSAFMNTYFDSVLRAAGIDHLIVTGMQTEYCVDTTVRAGFERGFRVTLVEDAHTTFDSPILRAADIIAHHNQTLRGSFATLLRADGIRFR